jgi:hypothetical protein
MEDYEEEMRQQNNQITLIKEMTAPNHITGGIVLQVYFVVFFH